MKIMYMRWPHKHSFEIKILECHNRIVFKLFYLFFCATKIARGHWLTFVFAK